MARKVFIFVPAFGGTVRAETTKTLLALQAALAQKGIQTAYADFSFPDISESRSIALSIWYDTMPDVDYLLFIDADMAFSPEIVMDMFLFDEPLVGTLYRQRQPNIAWAGSGNGPVAERRGDFMVVEGVGMGCTLIHRDVPRIMLAQMPEIVDDRMAHHPAGPMLKGVGATRMIRAFEKLDIPERGILSEDLSFCVRWSRCVLPDGSNGKVWASIGHRISHVGPFDYQGRYLDIIEAMQMQAMAGPALPVTSPVAATVQAQPYSIAAE